VTNGEEALKALAVTAYDLVLLDVQMPVMDGLETARHIREPGSEVLNHAVPIIAMTAHALQGDREKCLAAGMNDYVSKPVAPQALAETLEKWLGAGGETTSAGAAVAGEVETLAEPVVFDYAALVERMMGDEEITRKIMELFVQTVPEQIAELKATLAGGERKVFERQAHSLKGSAANVSGERMRAVALALEMAARAGDEAGMRTKLEALEGEFAALRKALEGELRGKK
jgi:CheY-like chemotaxis protein/HPt (histidine-containing phosphotransfer) domain-containing protein